MISLFLSAGEGLVPEPADEAQAPEAGGGVSGGAAEEEGQPARQPLEGRHAAAGRRRRGRHQRRLEHAHTYTVTHTCLDAHHRLVGFILIDADIFIHAVDDKPKRNSGRT